MDPVLMTERELLQDIWENYVLCMNACYPEARHCDSCTVQKRIDLATRCLDILQFSGMNSGNPDSDISTAAASDDPLQTIKEVCMDDLNVQDVVPEENNETVTAEEVVAAAQPEPVQSTAPTGYYDKFSGKYVQVTEKMNSKQKTKAVIKAVFWLLVGLGGLVWMIYSIFNLVF